MDTNMNESSCYFCRSPKSEFFASENGFTMVKCKECGLLYVSPRPSDTEIAEAARQGMHPGDLDVTGQFNPFSLGKYRRVLRDLYGAELAERQRSWLDIGCGYGEFLDALKLISKGKVHATGSEPNEHKQAAARQRGHDVTFFPLEEHRNTYDTISLLNVYSHLPDPISFISLVKRCLNPGGEIVIQTGDVGRLTPRSIYKPLSLPDHLSFATEEIVTEILNRAGFRVLTVQKYKPFTFGFTILRLLRNLALGRISKSKHLIINVVNFEKTDMWIRARLDY